MPRRPKDAATKTVQWVTVKVRPETKRLLDLAATAERLAISDLVEAMARERWARVKESDLLP